MRRGGIVSLGLLLLLLVVLGVGRVEGEEVRLRQEGDRGWELVRGGRPYLIKGGGGDGSMELLAKLGGNSVRTWGVGPSLGRQLDEAHRLGLTVCVGIWLGQVRQGFDYGDPAQVARQYESVKRAVTQYKDHPAVLFWGLGNEMEDPEGKNLGVWKAINELAVMVKEVDPKHPTMTVIAELGGEKVSNLHRLCPAIDVVGINSYGGAASVPQRYRRAGGEKPYVLTEFGPPGRWELQANGWGAPPELSSTAKGEIYRNAYEKAVLGAEGLCLGSYAFIWGFKQEATATWFGMLLPDGSRLAAADVMSEMWTGRPVSNRCPLISELKVSGADEVAPGATIKLGLQASDPEGDELAVEWVLQREAAAYGEGGDREAVPAVFREAIVEASARAATIRMPMSRGGYRVFAYVRDGQGGAAVVNQRVLVK